MSHFLQDSGDYQPNPRNENVLEGAEKLPKGGSTCDIFRTRLQRRQVFVKRLKEGYRMNPLYLDALEKEYDIGVSLKHPSLPYYREFHGDYIVMDYIDGETLAKMIEQKDTWLTNEKNILRMLTELVEVTSYLHRNHVTHCDIKPDNIMITANNHNLVLIDFDKCYSDSFNDTSGDPSKYGVEKEALGSVTIDFNGIARVVEKIKEEVPGFKFSKYSKFIKECRKQEVNPEDLLKILDYKPTVSYRKFYWMVTLAPFCVALLYGFVLWLLQGENNNNYEKSDGVVNIPAAGNDSVQQNKTEEPEVIKPGEENDKINKEAKPENVSDEELSIPAEKDKQKVEAKKIAEQLDKKIQPYYDELTKRLYNLEILSKNPNVAGNQLLDSIRTHCELENVYFQKSFEMVREIHPDFTEKEIWNVLSCSKAYTSYTRTSYPLLNKIGKKVEELGTDLTTVN